jgi:hypothetical protein
VCRVRRSVRGVSRSGRGALCRVRRAVHQAAGARRNPEGPLIISRDLLLGDDEGSPRASAQSSRRRPVRALAVAPPANPAPQRRAKVIGGASTFTEVVTTAATSLLQCANYLLLSASGARDTRHPTRPARRDSGGLAVIVCACLLMMRAGV